MLQLTKFALFTDFLVWCYWWTKLHLWKLAIIIEGAVFWSWKTLGIFLLLSCLCVCFCYVLESAGKLCWQISMNADYCVWLGTTLCCPQGVRIVIVGASDHEGPTAAVWSTQSDRLRRRIAPFGSRPWHSAAFRIRKYSYGNSASPGQFLTAKWHFVSHIAGIWHQLL